MANERLYQFPTKTSPVPADIAYLGDSANAYNEVQSTIAQIIGAYPNLSGIAGLTLSANTFPYSNASAVITAGNITALAITLLGDSTVSTMQGTLGYQAAPIASQFAGWDANKNISANSSIVAFATTATAAGTTTLTVSSAYSQFFTGSTTQTVVMPVASTLAQGQQFYIVNQSSGIVTVESSGTNTIIAMAANTAAYLTCILNSGTSAASWYAEYEQSSLTLPLSFSNGGTGQSLSSVNSAVFSTTSGGAAQLSTTLPSGLTIPLPLISGVINAGNAAAGNIGEVISSVIAAASAVSLSNNTAANVTSINLTAGDWDVWANVTYIANGTTTIGATQGWISSTSVTLPDASLYAADAVTVVAPSNSKGYCVPQQRFNVSGTTTVYLSCLANFSGGTQTACGGIYARRRR